MLSCPRSLLLRVRSVECDSLLRQSNWRLKLLLMYCDCVGRLWWFKRERDDDLSRGRDALWFMSLNEPLLRLRSLVPEFTWWSFVVCLVPEDGNTLSLLLLYARLDIWIFRGYKFNARPKMSDVRIIIKRTAVQSTL